jgi:hypothetical protein
MEFVFTEARFWILFPHWPRNLNELVCFSFGLRCYVGIEDAESD